MHLRCQNWKKSWSAFGSKPSIPRRGAACPANYYSDTVIMMIGIRFSFQMFVYTFRFHGLKNISYCLLYRGPGRYPWSPTLFFSASKHVDLSLDFGRRL